MVKDSLQFLYHTGMQHLQQLYNTMKEAELTLPHFSLVFPTCLTKFEGGGTDRGTDHQEDHPSVIFWFYESLNTP